MKRDGPVSGILIFDPKGNERGGYVTSDTGDLARLSLSTQSVIRSSLPTRTRTAAARQSGSQTNSTMPLPLAHTSSRYSK